MVLINEDTEVRDEKDESKERRYPSVDIAEARIKQALLKYRVMVDRITPSGEKEKVRL